VRTFFFGLCGLLATACGSRSGTQGPADAAAGAGGVTGAAGAGGMSGPGATPEPAGDGSAAGSSVNGQDASGPSDTGAPIGDALVEANGEDATTTDAEAATCPAGALCDDFESYATGTTDLAPKWTVYKYGGGTLQVDATKPYRGAKALHLTVPAGGRKYADIIKETADDTAVLPIRHYGRVMVWVTAMPSAAHWNINQAGGLLAGSTDVIAKVSYGGQNAKLMPNYTQRSRVILGATPLRGGGPQDGDPAPPPFDCSTSAPTEKLTTKAWVCWEWMFDGASNQMHLWQNGQPQPEVDVVGMGQTCVGGTNRVWQGPKAFSKVIIGWEQYTQPSDVANEVWLDDLVMSGERVGCPAP
jgi:hypothetical protein